MYEKYFKFVFKKSELKKFQKQTVEKFVTKNLKFRVNF
mgnify:CR=1 FL=1